MNNITFFPIFIGEPQEITGALMASIISGIIFVIFALMYFLGEKSRKTDRIYLTVMLAALVVNFFCNLCGLMKK